MAGSPFVSPTGYVDLDNDSYSIDNKSTRSREYVNPKEDLAFYFNTFIVPKYGLENINVNNVASFMKDLQMNWSKLSPDLKDKVMDIMVDGILTQNYDFKGKLIDKLGINTVSPQVQSLSNGPSISTFGKSKSKFGGENQDMVYIGVVLIFLGFVFFLMNKMKTRPIAFSKMI
jgi:hypothetical protein